MNDMLSAWSIQILFNVTIFFICKCLCPLLIYTVDATLLYSVFQMLHGLHSWGYNWFSLPEYNMDESVESWGMPISYTLHSGTKNICLGIKLFLCCKGSSPFSWRKMKLTVFHTQAWVIFSSFHSYLRLV